MNETGSVKHTANFKLAIYLVVQLGSDWADLLNEAVRSCHLFLAFVTPSYAATLWTSRELKLADQVGKSILPINFGQLWPPETLSIQLATCQFISWRPNSSSLTGLKQSQRTV